MQPEYNRNNTPMTIRSYIARLLSLGLAAAIATTAGFGQELPSSPAVSTTLPVVRTLTDTAGRKIDVTITEKTATAIKAKRVSDGKEFNFELTKLSAADQAFIAGLAAASAPPVKPRTVLLMDDNADLKPLLEKAGFIVTIPPTEKLNEDDAGNPIAVSYKYVTLSKYTDDQLKAFDLIWKGTGIGGSMQDKRTTKFNPSEKHDDLLESHPEILVQVIAAATQFLEAHPRPAVE